jgi:hypothetical protein
MTTVTYDVPKFKSSYVLLARYGDFDGNTLLHAVLEGDGQAIHEFLAAFAASSNEEFDRINARYDLTTRATDAIPAIVAEVSLTGFKAHANTDPKTKYRRPKVTNEGEGCGAGYCELAGKFRLPEAPEGLKDYKAWTLACQKHAIESINARAILVANGGQERYTYLTTDQHNEIKTAIRDALAGVKA